MSKKTLKIGSRRMVWNGSAEMTKGGLRKDNLIRNKYGRIVSTKRHSRMKVKHGGSDENGIVFDKDSDMTPEKV